MSFEDPFKDSGEDPLKGFNASIRGFDDSIRNIDNAQLSADNGSSPEKQSTAASIDNHRANLEHLRDINEFKMLQLVVAFSKAEGKTLKETLNDDELRRLSELSARISTEERINIMTEVNATFEKNKAAQNKNESNQPAESNESLIVCKNCGKKVKAGKFCEQCGKLIEVQKKKGKSILEADENKFFCLGCGKIAKPGSFCGNCGGRIFNGTELALFRAINIDPKYPLANPNEAANVLKKQRNDYIKKNFQEGNYAKEAEVKKVLEVYGKLISKLS